MSTETYTVSGMTCSHCVSTVTEEVGELAGVTGVDVDLDSGRLAVTVRRAGRRRPGARRGRGGRLHAGRLTGLTSSTTPREDDDVNAPTTLAAYGAALVVVFGAAVGVGHAVGPVGTVAPEAAAPRHGGLHGARARRGRPPGGLAVSQDGYTLLLDQARDRGRRRRAARLPRPRPRRRRRPRVRPSSTTGSCTWCVVRRDATGFQHLHPVRDDAGRWTTPLDPAERRDLEGVRRLHRRGRGPPRARRRRRRRRLRRDDPAARRAAHRRVDGYTVRLDGDLVAGSEQPAHPDGQPRRPPGDRPAALPRRLRPPRRAARAATWPTCTSTPRTARPGPTCASPPTSRRPATTGCSWTSGTATSSARPPSACAPPPVRPRRPPRHDSSAHDSSEGTAHDDHAHPHQTPDAGPLETVELAITGMTCASCANRIEKQAQQARGRRGDRQLRHREGPGALPGRAVPGRAAGRRRQGRLQRAGCPSPTGPQPATAPPARAWSRPTGSTCWAGGCCSSPC